MGQESIGEGLMVVLVGVDGDEQPAGIEIRAKR